MPGWYIHMDVARKALSRLAGNPGAGAIFGSSGPSASELEGIAQRNPAYTALGAIGPDLFFLLPDFKGDIGTLLYGAANTIKPVYEFWEENFLQPYEEMIGPIALNAANSIDAITGGLASRISEINDRAFKFILDTLLVIFTRQYDVFGFLGSGVPAGYDEKTYFWSDMLHYRKTYEFAAALWQNASEAQNSELLPNKREQLQAFALGWMTHLATDVVGHSFVNEKSGGPYRLHWQRHHLVENHMDARVYDSEHGDQELYPMLSSSALHLWVAFNPDGSSRANFFNAQPGPDYSTGDDSHGILDRKSKWDVDSDVPVHLREFLVETLKKVYRTDNTGGPFGQWADHPTILEDTVLFPAGHDGYPSTDDIDALYFYLYQYVRFTTTDYYSLRRPPRPKEFIIPPFPAPPGTGQSDPGPGARDNDWVSFLRILLAIFGWIFYLAQVSAWPVEALISLIASAGTRPIRELLYENVELPLYNAWAALHWYFAMTGFVSPMKEEINPGLMTLGVGVEDAWSAVLEALQDPAGGLNKPPLGTESSGADAHEVYPREVVQDDPGFFATLIDFARRLPCASGETPSEFLRPWLFPMVDNEGLSSPPPPPTDHLIKSELPLTKASPFRFLEDATVLFQNHPGDENTRREFEAAKDEADTLEISRRRLANGEHLGDPVDYSVYVIASLTRSGQGEIANFNLDADRGYGYLCWDWTRLPDEKFRAAPQSHSNHIYQAPVSAGSGWCQEDLLSPPPDNFPAAHQEGGQVAIRYIDREPKADEKGPANG